jgi:hypothetical protein
MAEDTRDQQPVAPVPQAGGEQKAVPQPTVMIRPPATAAETRPAPPSDDSNPLARAAELRRQAAAIEAAAGQGPPTVNVKIESPHSEMHFGGLLVGNEFAPVPRDRLAALQQAADNAGVTLITEG